LCFSFSFSSSYRERVVASDGDPHDHAFVKKAPEQSCATVQLARGASHPKVTSSVKGMVILKTTQSGFSGYHKVRHE